MNVQHRLFYMNSFSTTSSLYVFSHLRNPASQKSKPHAECGTMKYYLLYRHFHRRSPILCLCGVVFWMAAQSCVGGPVNLITLSPVKQIVEQRCPEGLLNRRFRKQTWCMCGHLYNKINFVGKCSTSDMYCNELTKSSASRLPSLSSSSSYGCCCFLPHVKTRWMMPIGHTMMSRTREVKISSSCCFAAASESADVSHATHPDLPRRNILEPRRLGSSDMMVGPLSLGTMTFGEQVGEREAHELLDYAVKGCGVNLLDTAEMYPVPTRPYTHGLSERIIGRWLNRNPEWRNGVHVATKICGYSKSGTKMLVEA
eukprot:GHVQ01036501.1.p1 GENE.GHVQ01036501.1~~GHVQ01036501.1.p1  ORF type:complete len:313 (+),score=31.36 GHVQ01036501.1:128-1066(+)